MSQKKLFSGFLMILLMGAFIFAGSPNRKIVIKNDLSNKPSLQKPYAEGEVLVKFKKDVSFNSVNQIAVQNAMTVKKHFSTLS